MARRNEDAKLAALRFRQIDHRTNTNSTLRFSSYFYINFPSSFFPPEKYLIKDATFVYKYFWKDTVSFISINYSISSEL